jgi:hypothetical protein
MSAASHRQDPRDCAEGGSIRPREPRAGDLTAQHSQLVAQHQDLRVLDASERASNATHAISRKETRYTKRNVTHQSMSNLVDRHLGRSTTVAEYQALIGFVHHECLIIVQCGVGRRSPTIKIKP